MIKTKANLKTILALMTGVLFLAFTTIPQTLFSQQVQQKEVADGVAFYSDSSLTDEFMDELKSKVFK